MFSSLCPNSDTWRRNRRGLPGSVETETSHRNHERRPSRYTPISRSSNTRSSCCSQTKTCQCFKDRSGVFLRLRAQGQGRRHSGAAALGLRRLLRTFGSIGARDPISFCLIISNRHRRTALHFRTWGVRISRQRNGFRFTIRSRSGGISSDYLSLVEPYEEGQRTSVPGPG